MTTALHARRPQGIPLRPQCRECYGGGEVNGLTCRECDGTGRHPLAAPLVAGWRRAARGWSLKAAEAAGKVTGRALAWSSALPGIGGAAAVSFGAAMVAHGVWRTLPEWGVFLLVAGVFGLMADRNLSRP
ncbi:MAG TPA: hypothetical protein VN714_14970 [Trebonia sp.]|nr:hypothetical protein [Trebonia sp.]